jgi:hypothetical protein
MQKNWEAANLAKKSYGVPGAGRQTFFFLKNKKKSLGAALLPKKVWECHYANGEYYL